MERCREGAGDRLDIFRRVFAPRAERFDAFTGNLSLGTIVAHPATGDPLEHLGITVFALDELAVFLHRNEAMALRSFDRIAYAMAAWADFEKYLTYHRASSHLLPEAAVQAVRAKLDVALRV